jgi:hypothetical protein
MVWATDNSIKCRAATSYIVGLLVGMYLAKERVARFVVRALKLFPSLLENNL